MIALAPSEFSFAAQWVYLNPTKGIPPSASGHKFTKRLLRFTTKSRSTAKVKVSERWRKAGWVSQFDWVTHQELTSQSVPLNQETVLLFPLVTGSYSLVFTPVNWLPNLTVIIYEYKGDDSEILLDPTIAPLMKSI